MRRMPSVIPLLLFLSIASGQVCAQITLTAKVVSVSGETIKIDSGKNSGLVEGLQGIVYYLESIDGKDVRIDVALAEIVTVDNTSAGLKISKKTDEIKTGYTVDLSAGTVSVTGTPANASISIDNRPIGLAPVAKRLIPPGNHTMQITMNEYENFQKSFTVSGDSPVEISYQLVPTFSLVSIGGALVRADVFIDGKKAGALPLAGVKLQPGRHSLKINALGCVLRPNSASQAVRTGKRLLLNVRSA